jgi:hypothetical protein
MARKRCRSILYTLLLVASPAFAQGFRQLATNRDGSVLYFSSPLRIKGTDQYFHPKIFTWDSVNGVRLYEQRASDFPFPPPIYFAGTQFFSLVAPDVSNDSSTVAVTGIRSCHLTGVCILDIEEYQSTIYAVGQPSITAAGSATLSRNGRYALLRSSIGGQPIPSKMQLLDLQTSQQTQYESAWLQPGVRHQVANDGTVVVQSFGGGIFRGGISLAQNGQLRTIISTNAIKPMINDAGTLVFYQSSAPQGARLSAYSVATGASTDLVADLADSPGFAASISDDGSEVAFLYGQNRQAYVIRSDGTGMRQITDFSEPVTDIELSVRWRCRATL